jgi:hypothetical protein
LQLFNNSTVPYSALSYAACYTPEEFHFCSFNFCFLFYMTRSRKPDRPCGQSYWLQIQRSGFDFLRYQIFWEVVGLERGPLSLVSIIEELLERNSSGSGLGSREYGCRDPSRWLRGTFHPQKLALTTPTRCGLSVGIIRSRTQATELLVENTENMAVEIRCADHVALSIRKSWK